MSLFDLLNNNFMKNCKFIGKKIKGNKKILCLSNCERKNSKKSYCLESLFKFLCVEFLSFSKRRFRSSWIRNLSLDPELKFRIRIQQKLKEHQGCGSAFNLCRSGSSNYCECESGSRSSLTKFEEKNHE